MKKEKEKKEISKEKEKSLLDVLRFKVTHCSAITRTIGKDNSSYIREAEKSVNKFVKLMISYGYSQEKLDNYVYRCWRYAEAAYDGKTNQREVKFY